jgi:hypothetical protein
MRDAIGNMAGLATARRKRAVEAARLMLRAVLDLALPHLCAVCR